MTARVAKSKKWQQAAVGVIVIFLVGVPTLIYFAPPPIPIAALKPLCDFVHRDLQLECPTILGAEDLFALGATVSVPEKQPVSTSGETTAIGLPISSLLSETCQVPGTAGIMATPVQKSVVLPDIEYQIKRSFFGKASFAIPDFADVKIEPGVNADELSVIKLKVAKAWTKNLNADALTQAISSCSIKLSCLENLKTLKYRIINNVVVGEGVKYEFLSSTQSELSINGAIDNGIVKIQADDATKSNIKNQNLVVADTPVVLAFGLLPQELLLNMPLCVDPIITRASGQSSLTAIGGGNDGNIGGPHLDLAAFGQTADLSVEGSERSRCNEAFERTKSLVRGTARVTAPNNSSLKFESNLDARGGHFATAAACLGSTLIGKVGFDNTTSLTASMKGSIRVTVRSNQASMFLQWTGMPEIGSTLRVIDPSGRPVLPSDEKSMIVPLKDGTIVLPKEGLEPFRELGPGVYTIETTVETAQTANGAGQKREKIDANLIVSFK